MSYITDKNIHLYYTQSYREKISRKGGATPTYFSLIDSEINYNLVNIDDGIVDNNGFENNSVTGDLDGKIFDVPVLEPSEDMTILRSAIYGYWGLGSVPNIESIGAEVTSDQSEYTHFKKYTLTSEYSQIPDQALLSGDTKAQIRADVFGLYRDYFTLQSSSQFFFYEQGVVTDMTPILQSLSGGTIENTYALYRTRIPNSGNAQKQLSESQVRIMSNNFSADTRGYLRMTDPSYFPSHKTYLHLYSDQGYVVVDVTGEDMTASIPYAVNPLYVSQTIGTTATGTLGVQVWFESMFKVFLNNQFVLFRSQTPKIQIEIIF